MSQTLDRALLILERLGVQPSTIGELATYLGVHNSTALRFLQALEARRFVRRDRDHRYRLGGMLLTLAQQALDTLDIRQAAQPYMLRLNQSTGHTVHLAEFDGEEVVYIDKLEGRTGPRIYSKIGKRAPLHCTGVAKAIVAFLPDAERVPLVLRHDYRMYTPRTIRNAESFVEELGRIHSRGYALDDHEHEPDVCCIAAPIREPGGRVRYAISLTTSTDDLQALTALAPMLLAVTRELSAELGWVPRSPVNEPERLPLAPSPDRLGTPAAREEAEPLPRESMLARPGADLSA